MNADEVTLAYRRLRAPEEDGQALLDPPLGDAAINTTNNRRHWESVDYDVQGCRLAELARRAKCDLLNTAVDYTSAYRNVDAAGAGQPLPPIISSGHQPALFHAGVWFKNFALSELARRVGGRAVNLIIDNDTAKDVSIRVPSGSLTQPRVEAIPFDRPGAPIAYEQRRLVDRALFQSFAQRVQAAIEPLVARPLVRELWRPVDDVLLRTGNLGRALAELRHRLEQSWGLETLEVPLSEIARQPAFQWFTVHLLAQLARFRRIHNSSLAEYRGLHRIRSRAHPVPDLQASEDWLEAPFWIWTDQDPQRRALFCRHAGGGLELTDRHHIRVSLPVADAHDASTAVDQLQQSLDVFHIRPRALTTTMFARIFLCDMFIHGIGGAKYDQLTDLIVQRFFGFVPPKFTTVTATMRLPLPTDDVCERDVREIERYLRDLDQHPELHVGESESARSLVADKAGWIAQKLPRGQRRQRHQELERLTAELRRSVSAKREAAAKQRDILVAQARINTRMSSREYSFCLFPGKDLRSRLLERLTKDA